MATYTVTTTADAVDPSDGQLSLREALAQADSDPATADTIDFDTAVQGGRIVLAGSQLTIGSDVTIDGGAGVTLDANQQSRVLLVQGGDTAATLAHLTVTHGNVGFDNAGGGGVRAEAGTTLTLDRTTVVENQGGTADGAGIYADTVHLIESVVADNSTGGFGRGGGIRAHAATLTDSEVRDNGALYGGGVYADTVILTGSTINDNHAGSAFLGRGEVSRHYR